MNKSAGDPVYRALLIRGERPKAAGLKNPYVTLYSQKPNCAVLYSPDAKCGRGPLHLNPRVGSFDAAAFARISPYIEFKVREKKPSGFDEYVVTDWDGLAAGLGLD